MIDPEHKVPDDVVNSFPILSLFINFNFIGNSLLYFNRLTTSTSNEQKWMANQPPSGIPSFSDRPQRSKLSSPNASRRPLQEDDHQMVKNLSIGSCRHSGTGFQGKFSIFPVTPISPYTYIVLSGCIGYYWSVIGNFILYQILILQQIPTIFFCFYV